MEQGNQFSQRQFALRVNFAEEQIKKTEKKQKDKLIKKINKFTDQK